MSDKEVWVKFACAALSGVYAGDLCGGDVDDIVAVAAEGADYMLKEYKERWTKNQDG